IFQQQHPAQAYRLFNSRITPDNSFFRNSILFDYKNTSLSLDRGETNLLLSFLGTDYTDLHGFLLY
ncbi:MAG: hypothetical protein K2I11_02040, partial [Bacteroides sp.]|nr:hypothetical protein [Bacteroides sp.]